MPFKEIYSVNFENGNLKPRVNLAGWPAMQVSPSSSNDHATRSGDSEGLKLRVIRATDDPVLTESRNIVFLAPPPFPVDIRLCMRLTFDLPRADNLPPGFPAHAGSVEPAEGGARPPRDTSQGAPVPSAPLDVPERWGVALSVSHSLETNIVARDMANVFCQFNRQTRDGVRLLTPVQLQGDDAGLLDHPLRYENYAGTSASSSRPALFTLEHSFCGYHLDRVNRAIGHTVGSGYLKIDHLTPKVEVKRDRRDYSSKTPLVSLVAPAGRTPSLEGPSIKSLRVTLLTATVGVVRARIRTFSLHFDPDAPQPVTHPVTA